MNFLAWREMTGSCMHEFVNGMCALVAGEEGKTATPEFVAEFEDEMWAFGAMSPIHTLWADFFMSASDPIRAIMYLDVLKAEKRVSITLYNKLLDAMTSQVELKVTLAADRDYLKCKKAWVDTAGIEQAKAKEAAVVVALKNVTKDVDRLFGLWKQQLDKLESMETELKGLFV